MKKFIIIGLIFIVLILIVVKEPDKKTTIKETDKRTTDNESYVEETLEEFTSIEETFIEETFIEEEEETSLSLPTVKSYLDDQNHLVDSGDYWYSLLANDFAVPQVTNKNLRSIVTGLLMGYSDCIFATNDFNSSFKGYFNEPTDIKVLNIDFDKEKLTVRTKMHDGVVVVYTVKYTIKDSLIDSLIILK